MKKIFIFILLSIIGFSAKTQTAYISNYSNNTVSVIDIPTNTVTYTISVGNGPFGISVSPNGNKVYVGNNISNTVSVINTATNTVSATITVGASPQGLAVSPDGSKVYVANNSGTVSVINTSTNTVSATITGICGGYGISVSPDGSKIYVANSNCNTVSVISTFSNTILTTIGVSSFPVGVSVSPDGSMVYVANFSNNSVSVINTAVDTVSATIPVGIQPHGVCVSPDGSKVYVANGGESSVKVINTATNTVIATVGLNCGAFGISVCPDGSKVYVAECGVSVINTSTNMVSTSIGVGSSPLAFGNFISTYTPPPPVAYFEASTSTICKGDSVQYSDTSLYATSQMWTFQNGSPASSTAQNPLVLYNTAGTHSIKLVVTNVNGKDSITKHITVNSLPSVTATASSNSVCAGNSVVLNSGGAQTYSWNGGESNGNPFTPSASQSYTVTGTDLNGCTNTASIYINVKPLPFVTAIANPNPVCAGNSVILNGGGAQTYSWSEGVTNGGTFTPVISQIYTVTGTDANGCQNTADVWLNVFSASFYNFTVNNMAVAFSMDSSSCANNGFLWDFGNGIQDSIAKNPAVNFTNAGIYTVCLRCNNFQSCWQCLNITVPGHYSGGVGINESVINSSINIYPNPATNNIRIENPYQAIIDITNIQGQLIKTTATNGNKTDIDILAFPSGVYFVKVRTEKGVEVRKFVKE